MPRLFGLLLVLAVAAAACVSAPTAPPENVLGPTELTRSGGCADAFVYVTNAQNTVAVTVEWTHAASRALETGEFQATAALPDDEVNVSIEFGQGLSADNCTDVIEPGMPTIVARAQASAGEVEIVVLPAPGAEPFMPLAAASPTLRDVVFEVPVEDSFEIWRIELLELPEVQVGWLAG